MNALVGRLALHPGREPAIAGARQQLAARVATGCAPNEAPDRLARVFNLCGDAHRFAARLALAGARVQAPADTCREAERLHGETAREHARRIAFDWARAFLPAGGDADAGTWLRALDFAGGAPALAGWLERTWFGEAPSAWHARIESSATRVAAFRDWLDDAPSTPLVCLLRAMLPHLRRAEVEWHPLHPTPQVRQTLLHGLRADVAFATYPHLDAAVPDSGPWSRLADAPDAWAGDASARVFARVAETAALASGARNRLRFGSMPLGAGEGAGWCEMARGLLLHWVRLDGDGTRVADWRVLAPTEWNFHPRGVLGRALSRLRGSATDSTVRVLAAAFDPCVGVDIVREEADHA